MTSVKREGAGEGRGASFGKAVIPVSVALATYNGARLVEEQLDSILAQSCWPEEIVVSDDCSTDSTLAVVRAYSRLSPIPIRVLDSTERLGFADNFLRAAAHCRSQYVAFCDQDDVWLPDKLELGHQRLIEDRSVLSMHTLTLTNSKLEPYATFSQGISADAVFEPLQLDPYITGWGNTMMFDRTLLDLIPYRERPAQPEAPGRPLSHDTWIYTLAAATGRVSHIAKSLCLYRQHDSNVSGAQNPSIAEKISGAAIVPIYRYRARMEFNDAMAKLFLTSASGSGGVGLSVAGAGAVYTGRRDQMALRIQVYSGSVVERAKAFIHLARMSRSAGGAYGGKASLMKDALLGLCYLGILHQHPSTVLRNDDATRLSQAAEAQDSV